MVVLLCETETRLEKGDRANLAWKNDYKVQVSYAPHYSLPALLSA